MTTVVVPSQYGAYIEGAAAQYGIDPGVLASQLYHESGFNPYAVSPSGAEGIAQFLPSTAAQQGVNPWDVQSSIYGAAAYDANLGYSNDPALALASYNAGPGNPSAGAGYAQTVLADAGNVTGISGAGGAASGAGGSYLTSSDFTNQGTGSPDLAQTQAAAASAAATGGDTSMWGSIVNAFTGPGSALGTLFGNSGGAQIATPTTTQVTMPSGSVYDLGLPQATGAAGQDVASAVGSAGQGITSSLTNFFSTLESDLAGWFSTGAIVLLAVVLIGVAGFALVRPDVVPKFARA